jgi:ABC-type branched-subunit amino acid transport system substrate-binding protein/TolA-binding protein
LRLFFLVLFIASQLFAQTATKREWAIFNKGVQDYKAGDYEQAARDFEIVLSKLPNNHLQTAHHLMLAKSFYKSGKYKKSLAECENFKKKYPQSRYLPFIYMLEGNNYFRLDRLQTAVEKWLKAAENSKEKTLREKALKLADTTVRYRLDDQGLAYLQHELRSDFALQFVLYHQAERSYEKNNFPSAQAALKRLLDLNGHNTIYEAKAQKMFDYLGNKQNSAIRVAALLPLSGANADVGQALLAGAQLVVDKYNREKGLTVELVPFDYETRIATALQRLKEISGDLSISAVYGPVENDIATACAAMADYEHIPLITPTATEKGLRTLSGETVQLSIPMDVVVQKLGHYVQDSLHLRRFATVAPIDDYFVRLTRMFIKQQEQLGGELVADQWYYPGDQDITPHFKALKRVGIKLMFQDSVMQEDSTLTQAQVDSLYKLYQTEQTKILQETNTRIDSADIAVKTIDALYMPVFTDDISMIASQYAYWNVQAQVLGNSDWYDEILLKKNRRYINGLIFTSDGYLNKERFDFRRFRNSFRDANKRTPGKYELIGYDTFNFILSALNGVPKNISREDFLEAIKAAPLYNGVYRNFDVGKKRYNDAVRILKYTNGLILPVQ